MPISSPISDLTTNPKDVVIIQRSNDNSSFGEVRISGSELLLHIDANGYVNADKSSSFYTLYPPPSAGLVVGGTYAITASWAVDSVNGSGGGGYSTSASWASHSLSSDSAISASWASHSLTSGTSSWAVNAINGGTQLVTGSTYPITASWAEYVVNGGGGTSDSSSWASQSLNSDSAISASWASHSLTTDTSSHAGVAGLVVAYPDSAGSHPVGLLGSNTGYVNVYADGGGYLTYDTSTSTLTSPIITASFLFGTSSWAVNAISASWAPGTGGGSSDYSISSSWASQSLSASWAPSTPSDYAISASWASSSVTAVTASSLTFDTMLYASSSMQADIALLAYVAITSSYAVTSSWAVNAINGGTQLITGSLYPITTSWAETSSWALNAINGGTTLQTGSTYPITSSWAQSASWASTAAFSDSSSFAILAGTTVFADAADFALDSQFSVTASYANVAATASLSVVYVQYGDSSSYASASATASYCPYAKSVGLCAAYTPAATGADAAEITIPYSPLDGTTLLTWNVKRLSLRAQTAETTTSSVDIEKSTGTGAFSGSTVGTLILSSGSYETFTGSLSSVDSGDKIRFNVTLLGNATNWTIITEISNA